MVAALSAAIGGVLLGAVQAAAYDVRPGDTLTSISRQTGVPVSQIVRDNGLKDPNHIAVGQHLVVGSAQRAPEAVSGGAARRLVVAAAHEFGLNPNFALAVSHWESGDNQVEISKDGAIGMMQILPATAQWAGPALLGGRVDIYLARDNARLGVALLARYLNDFGGDPHLALAAYYQGESATRQFGIYPSSRSYVDGVWALRNALQAANGTL